MQLLRKLYRQEIKEYFALEKFSRGLFLSFLFFSAAEPLLFTFRNAYIWLRYNDISLIISFFIASVSFTSFGIFLNSVLLKRFNLRDLYSAGMVLYALGFSCLVFLPDLSPLGLMLMGAINGICTGIYWGNRHILAIMMTKSNQRDYFFHLIISCSIIFSVFTPALFGYAIEMIKSFSHNPYTYVIVLLNLWLLAGIIFIRRINFPKTIPVKLGLRNPGPGWNSARYALASQGFYEGILLILPVVMILYKTGSEIWVGLITSLASLITALLIYYLGKHKARYPHWRQIQLGVGLLSISSIASFLSFSLWPIVIFTVLARFYMALFYANADSLFFNIISEDSRIDKHFAYICDRDLFLSFGRTLGMFLVLIFNNHNNTQMTLQFLPMIFAPVLIIVIFNFRRVNTTRDALVTDSSPI